MSHDRQVSAPSPKAEVCPERVSTLATEVRTQCDLAGLQSVQWALALGGEVIAGQTLGCSEATRFIGFSTTKIVMASLTWRLVDAGVFAFDEPVAHYLREFDTPSKRAVTLAQLLSHTAGFPDATIAPLGWDDEGARSAALSSIEPAWEPGSRFQYHASSSMWVLAEVIERATGHDYRLLAKRELFEPLGLRDSLTLGAPPGVDLPASIASVGHVGQPPAPERVKALGLNLTHDTPAFRAYVESFNDETIQRRGVPSAGLIASADGLALFYQALLGLGSSPALWSQDTLARALSNQTGEWTDPMTGRLACRGLGPVIAHDRNKHYRGFGMTCSDRAFGHMGAGGQVAWADPATGLSFVLLTGTHDRDVLRQGMRMVRLSTLAAAVVA